ncbi:MAG: N-acetylglucosamine-6-phosphate deacetylase [Staphylothermus sp.]|nr:N-acetylglucosamine-6-phosphate deacetylase [Staphylothermus sp.]
MNEDNNLLLRNAKIYTPYEVIDRGYILIEKGIIKSIGKEPYPYNVKDLEVIDLEGNICGPGFIDTHIHGILGYDTMDGRKESFIEMSKILVKHGVTAFIPSTVTSSHEKLVKVSKAIKDSVSEWKPKIGSRILGLHLEGPYINPAKAGAQNKQYIREPSIDEFNEYYDVSNKLIREITIAPEIKDSIEFIEYVVQKNVIVQIGHTNATYDEAIRGIIAGATKATHLYNGMRNIHHREPGVVVALLNSPNVFLEIITDFIHVSPQMIKFTIDYAGIHRIVLITDAISATGLPNGIYELGGLKIEVVDGVSRLVETGGFAGSTLTMDKAFRNILSLGYSIKDAFIMASTNPARSIHADKLERIGILKPGYRADIIVLDKNYDVIMTLIDGHAVYEK